MTDHLADARACIQAAAQAPHPDTRISWLTATCKQIIDHLEAQNTPQEATSADLTTSEPEPDQLGGEGATSGYTPTTDEVREAYGYWSDSGPHAPPDEFNRWLDSIRAEVTAQALREAADDYRAGQITGIFASRDEHTKAWLCARADQIEEGEG